ncbi:hypothetical protein I5S53_02360 [Pseudomonas juntendi]|uniref:hypothetical protein n=1 Tax=Pseudomonas juntendi TaxID=2666183 RepID=UPI0018D5D02E|nr:hypothetical protein [Pseudomonas juntendi]MBH3382821.1 hypothetical protein [Pseudomonas juntendi]
MSKIKAAKGWLWALAKNHWGKILSGISAACLAVGGWAATNLQQEIKTALKLQKAAVTISTTTPKVELHKKIDLEAHVDSVGLSSLSPGILTIEVDHNLVAVKPKATVKVKEISGTDPVESMPEVKVIKDPSGGVKISALYVSGSLRVRSNELWIEVIPPIRAMHPHFDVSDTGRVNLSGDWSIEVGGIPGKMTLAQTPDNNIIGTYVIPGGKWPEGKIEGFKDGKTFRVRFSVPGKDRTETIRVAAFFELHSSNGDFIELTGCAYHLRKSNAVYGSVGVEGRDCSASVQYDRWKVLQTASFYASSPFDKQER